MRLDKLLMEQGFGSRRTIKRLLFSKQVTVDGQITMQENLNVDPTFQCIQVNGKAILNGNDVYYLMHKPKGVVCAVRDVKAKTVLDLITETDKVDGLYPVGRLDGNTTGLLLITNNGRLGYRLLHPKFHVAKTYEVVVNGWIDDRTIERFYNGIIFPDGVVCKSAKLSILEQSEKQSRARVTISEGKYHQIKKMFLCVGVKVMALKRVAFGPLQLDAKLLPGQYRPLTVDELKQLKEFFV